MEMLLRKQKGSTATMPNHLPLLTHRIHRQDNGDDESALARQWRMLEQSYPTAAKGLTIKEFVVHTELLSEKDDKRPRHCPLETGWL